MENGGKCSVVITSNLVFSQSNIQKSDDHHARH